MTNVHEGVVGTGPSASVLFIRYHQGQRMWRVSDTTREGVGRTLQAALVNFAQKASRTVDTDTLFDVAATVKDLMGDPQEESDAQAQA